MGSLCLSGDSNFNHLTEKQYLTLIVRLLIDHQGKLQYGTLVDVNNEIVGHFRQLDELPDLIARWLESLNHKQDPATNESLR